MKDYGKTLQDALDLLNICEGLEIRSALKQCAIDNGIEEGEPLKQFVQWAEDKLFNN